MGSEEPIFKAHRPVSLHNNINVIEPVYQLEEHEPLRPLEPLAEPHPHDFIASDPDPTHLPINQDISNVHVDKDEDIIVDSYHHDVTNSVVDHQNNDRFHLDNGKFFGHHGSHYGRIIYC